MGVIRDMMNYKCTLQARKALGVCATLNFPFGLWPLEEDGVSLRIRWIFVILTIIVVFFQAVYETYLDCVHTENNVENLYALSFGTIGLAKMIAYYRHRDKLRLNVESAIKDWSSREVKSFSAIMHNYKRMYTKVTYALLSIAICGSSLYCVKIFLIDPDSTIEVENYEDGHVRNVTRFLKPRFVLPGVCSFREASQFRYWVIFGVQLFQYEIFVGLNVFCDAFFIAIVNHLCGQFEILKMKFASFKKLRNMLDSRQKFAVLIARHKQLLKLADQLETSFNFIVFVQMIMNLTILLVAGFNFLVFLKRGEILSAVSNASVISFALVQTFMYSYIGDLLTGQGADIAQSVYDIEWYTMPTNFSKDLVTIMAQTCLPIGLTAGKFFKMTRSTFTDILKTAVSYLSVLRILIDDKRL